ncbi:MAG: hypothetical protein HND48_25035 [Chloroflexi bacterium]|nr:hypothetical protein [Chloroflexota bacterium]
MLPFNSLRDHLGFGATVQHGIDDDVEGSAGQGAAELNRIGAVDAQAGQRLRQRVR